VVTLEAVSSLRGRLATRFRKDDLRYLCNVGMLTTGFDAPATNVLYHASNGHGDRPAC
jgi:superfamily II DNA or RNA helicase